MDEAFTHRPAQGTQQHSKNSDDDMVGKTIFNYFAVSNVSLTKCDHHMQNQQSLCLLLKKLPSLKSFNHLQQKKTYSYSFCCRETTYLSFIS